MERPGRCCDWVLVGLGAAACTTNPAAGGPLPVRNQHPAQLTVLHQAPASARVLAAGRAAARVDAAYTSLFLRGSRGGDSFTMDGEYLRVANRLRAGLGAGLELGLELPVAHASGGFLDSFLIDYHEWFGFPDQNRSTTPRDRFEVRAIDNGNTVFELDRHGVELLDVPLQLTWQLLAATADRPGLAVRGAVELPTGDDERGYGNGQVDYGIGLLAEHRTGAVAWYGHLQHTFAGTPGPARRLGFDFADVTSMGLASELPLTADLAALVQVEWETSTLRALDLAVATREHLLLWVGGRWQAGADWSVEVGFGEDLQSLVSPDFTAWLGVVWLPGGSRLPR
jgi:Protein of unknown function (DUF3187)